MESEPPATDLSDVLAELQETNLLLARTRRLMSVMAVSAVVGLVVVFVGVLAVLHSLGYLQSVSDALSGNQPTPYCPYANAGPNCTPPQP